MSTIDRLRSWNLACQGSGYFALQYSFLDSQGDLGNITAHAGCGLGTIAREFLLIGRSLSGLGRMMNFFGALA
jgi:hypothetical protein